MKSEMLIKNDKKKLRKPKKDGILGKAKLYGSEYCGGTCFN